jgi:hypothetical protein
MSTRAKFLTIAAGALLALSSCAREEVNSDGADPQNAESKRDAAPGPLSETSPPSTPANDPPQE